MSPSYAELHCLTNFSFLRGASHPEELVERAAQLGYAALAITDECSLAGVVRAHVAAKAHGLKLIVGAEVGIEARGETKQARGERLEARGKALCADPSPPDQVRGRLRPSPPRGEGEQLTSRLQPLASCLTQPLASRL